MHCAYLHYSANQTTSDILPSKTIKKNDHSFHSTDPNTTYFPNCPQIRHPSFILPLDSMKITHQKRTDEMSENRNQNRCDCRYKVMEAKAEVETHVAAGEKLKSEREKYKSLFHQYAKERKCIMDRLQASEFLPCVCACVCLLVCLFVCLIVCARARARVCVCVCGFFLVMYLAFDSYRL